VLKLELGSWIRGLCIHASLSHCSSNMYTTDCALFLITNELGLRTPNVANYRPMRSTRNVYAQRTILHIWNQTNIENTFENCPRALSSSVLSIYVWIIGIVIVTKSITPSLLKWKHYSCHIFWPRRSRGHRGVMWSNVITKQYFKDQFRERKTGKAEERL